MCQAGTFYTTSAIVLWSSLSTPRVPSLGPPQISPVLVFLFLGDMLFRCLLCMRYFYTFKYLEHKLLAALLNRSAHAAATSPALALDWLEALVPCADLIAGQQWSFSLWWFNSLRHLSKIKIIIPNF